KGSVKIPAGAAFNAEQAESSLRFVGFVEPARRDSAVLDLPFVNSEPDKTYDAVDGAAARRVVQSGMDMARAAAEADKSAIGWARVTQGVDACSLCSMLESRGMVYDVDSFEVVDSRFIENSLPPTVLSGELTAKTHDHCRCVLVPVFSRTSDIQKNADGIYATWKTVQRDYAWLRRSAGVDMIQIWRWYWEGSLASVAEKWAGVGQSCRAQERLSTSTAPQEDAMPEDNGEMPWEKDGVEFDADAAKKLILNLRGEKKTLQERLKESNAKTKN